MRIERGSDTISLIPAGYYSFMNKCNERSLQSAKKAMGSSHVAYSQWHAKSRFPRNRECFLTTWKDACLGTYRRLHTH